MKYAWFPGCKIPFHQPAYGMSARLVLDLLGVDITEIEFNCCGYPVRHHSLKAFLVSAARNFALAQRAGLPVLTPCKCCFGSLKHALYTFRHNPQLLEEANMLLSREKLSFTGDAEVLHILGVLAQDDVLHRIRSAVTRKLSPLQVAVHYGCHALRPSYVTNFDDPETPGIFEDLVEALGARAVDWALRLECCGYPLREKNDRLSDVLMKRKLQSACDAGADILCTACTYCQMQFQAEAGKRGSDGVPSVLITQLLGLALGSRPEELGLRGDEIFLTISDQEERVASG